jgi:hypothetical protein
MWAALGFSRNPYDTEPVPPSDDGDFLLVGRDAEVADLTARLTAGSTIPVLVGANGVGKTSIVSVAAYRLSRARSDDGPRYLVLDEPLQLSSAQTLDRFVRDAYYRIAKVLLDEPELLARRGVKKGQVKALRRWLRDPDARQRSFGVSTPFGGGSLQTGGTPSNSEGFKGAGMQMMVDEWLDRCFAESTSGGIVCLIDNLEILKTSAQAREAVEALRDGLFAKRGLRWVLCGTPAVIGGGALFSARMEGRIAPPIQIRPVASELAPELVTRRLERFGSSEAYAPVDGQGFERVYAVVNSRLRYALDLCQEFAFFLHAQGRRPVDADDRAEILDSWLAVKANEFAQAASDVPARSWRLLDDLTDLGGEIRGREADVCRFDSAEDLAAAATSLCRTGLLERIEADEGDYVLQLTTPGWLVSFQRRDYEL